MVRDKITHLLFGRDVAQNATGIADVDQGEIIVIGKGGAILSAAAITNLGGDEPFYIVEGKLSGNSSHIISPKLTKNSIKAHRGTSYAAATQQVSYIGNSGSGTEDINLGSSTVETEFTWSISFIHDKDIYSQRHNVRHYSYLAPAAATVITIATEMAAIMNADAEFASQAVAAVVNNGADYGVRITGLAQTNTKYDNPVLVNFKIALDLGFNSTTAVDEYGYKYVNGAAGVAGASVAPKPGVGTYAQLKAMEHNNIGFTTGQTNHRKFPIVEADARISSTGTYDVYVIDYTDTHESADNGLSAKRTTEGQIIIANDISTTVNGSTAAIEALLFAITGVSVNL